MKKIFTAICCFVLSCLEANVSLSNLVEYDKATCLERLEKASDAELWEVFLEGQANLFFDSECQWIANGYWWHESHNMLEIGSGSGAYLHKLACVFPEKIFRGVEKLPEPVKRANERYASCNLSFQKGDAEVLDEQLINSCDLVLFRLTLQHLKDYALALKNAAEYLSSTGYVLIIDACDMARRTSHPIPTIEETLKLVAEVQKGQGKGNRRVTLELLQALNIENSSLSNLYEVVFSNLDANGNVLCESIRFEGKRYRSLQFNHSLLFLVLLHRTYHVPIDLSGGYDELMDYLNDEGAWTSPGMHYLVLQKH